MTGNGEELMAEKLFCDFCQREIDKREQKYEVRIAVDAGISVMLRRDACLECAKKIETILVGLPLGIAPSR